MVRDTGEKEGDDMKMSNKQITYQNEPMQMGKRTKDFLPRPEELVFRPKGVKVTITMSEDSIHYFKDQAELLKTPYQRMIRNLIDEYVRQMR